MAIRRHRPLLSRAMIAMPMALLAAIASITPALADCATDGVHWYARGSSGCCAVGNDVLTTTPANWSAQPGSSSDIGSWLITNNQTFTPAIEVGFYTGYWGPTGDFTYGLVPYYILHNSNLTDTWSRNPTDFLSPSTSYHLTGVEGTPGYIEVGWNTPQDWRVSINFSVTQGTNSSQGEVVKNSNTWMGGGPHKDEDLTNSFCLNACSSWQNWGYNNNCQNAPYVATWKSNPVYGVQGPD